MEKIIGALPGPLSDIGDYGAALALLDEVYESRKRILGVFHTDTLLTLGNRGSALLALGRGREALEDAEGLLQYYRETLEENHPRIFRAMSTLGLILNSLGDFEGAEKLLYEALEHNKRIYGEAHEITLTTMGNLAGALRVGSNLERAHVVAVNALRLSSTHLGEQHSRTIFLMTALAEILRAQGDILGAQKISERVFSLYRSKFGDEAFQTLLAANNLATLMIPLGDTSEAHDFLKESLATATRRWGVEHRVTTTLAWNLYYQTKVHDPKYAQSIVVDYLSWLCKKDLATLNTEQHHVRSQIC